MSRFTKYQSKRKEVREHAISRFHIEVNPFLLSFIKIRKSEAYRNKLRSNFGKYFDYTLERLTLEYDRPIYPFGPTPREMDQAFF